MGQRVDGGAGWQSSQTDWGEMAKTLGTHNNWGLKCCFINKSICVANILIFFNIYTLNKLFSQSNTFIFKGLWQK